MRVSTMKRPTSRRSISYKEISIKYSVSPFRFCDDQDEKNILKYDAAKFAYDKACNVVWFAKRNSSTTARQLQKSEQMRAKRKTAMYKLRVAKVKAMNRIVQRMRAFHFRMEIVRPSKQDIEKVGATLQAL